MNLSAQIPLQNKHNLLYWGIAVSLGFCMAISGYLWAFQTPLFARREYAFALLLWFLLIPLVYVLLTRFLHPRLLRYSPKARRNWILLSAGVGILFALVTHPPQAILLLPVHHLQINLPGGSADRAVTLEYAKTSLRDIGFGEFLQKGDWQRTKTGFTHTGGEPASLTWSGRSGETATLVFSNSPGIAEVQAGWDGNLAALNPAESPGAPVIASSRFPGSWMSTLFSNLMAVLTAGFLFLVLTIFLAGVQIKPAPVLQPKKGFWLLYALPMIAVWGIYLLTFFPAVMTPDSIRQWGQVISGQFNDALPVVHTLLVILLTRLWFSPAVVIVFQIIALALTVAWGIHLLEDQGLPRWAGWGLALVFALSPVNGNMVVSLWKDIPYSICLLLLSLMILKAIFSKGTWLGERFSWLWLTLVGLGISLFRLNGLPVPILSLIVLAIVYRNQWKRVLLSVGVIAGTWLLIQGPIYTLLKVDRNAGFKQQVFIHHIAAHIATGSPLTPAESDLASGILPLDQWSYDCCTNIPIWTQPAYSEPRFTEKAADIQSLFADLAVKEPGVELQHLVCVSSLVWEVPNHCMLNQEKTEAATVSWIEPNDLGLKENSLLSAWIVPLAKLKDFASRKPWDVLFFTPALFLYLGLFCSSMMAYRARQPRFLLFFLPAAVQSAVMLFINVSRDFRYQYGVYLVGLFSLGLLILSFTFPRDPAAHFGHNHSGKETGAEK